MLNPRPSTILSLVLMASLNAAPAHHDEAQDQYRVAAGHYSQKRWELACDEFQAFIHDYPADPQASDARFYAAEALMQLERYAEARAEFQKLLDGNPAHRFARQASFRLGEAGYLAGSTAEAERDLEKFGRKYPDDDRNHFALAYLGELKLRAGQAAAAEKFFRKAIEQAGDGANSARSRFGLAKSLEKQEKTDEANRLYQQIASDKSSEWADRAEVGHISLRLAAGQYEEAAKAFQDFGAAYPHSPLADHATRGRGTALYKLGRFEEAAGAFTLLERHADLGIEAQYWHGMCLVSLGKFAEAGETIEKCLKAHPTDATRTACLAALVNCQAHLGRFDDAMKSCNQLRHVDGQKNLALCVAAELADAAYAAGNQKTARGLFTSLSDEENPPRYVAKGLSGLAWVEFREKDWAAAAETFDQLLKRFPDDSLAPEAALVRAHALEKLDQPDAALAMYQLLLEKYPRSTEAPGGLARAAQLEESRKHFEQAIEFYRRLADEYKGFAGLDESIYRERVLYLEGKLAIAHERWNEVETPLARLLKDFPDGPFAISARYWLAEAEYRQGHFREAAAQFAKLAEQTKEFKPGWWTIVPLRQAQSLAQLDEWQEAFQIAQKLEADFPEMEQKGELHYLLGRCLASRADFAAAREYYRRVIHSKRDGQTEAAAMAQWMIGESYFHQENYRSALAEYLRVEVLYDYPRWQAASLLQAGKCQERLGQWKAAAETYARLVKVYPDSEVADDAARRLEIARQKQQVVSTRK